VVILFDLDGTLIDSTEAILESFHHSFDYFGLEHPSDKEITALIGHPLDVMYARLGVQKDQVEQIVQIYKQHYREISTQKTKLLDGAYDAVLEAKEFATLGIVTTKTGRYSKILMEHFGLMHYFDVLIGREDVIKPKPHKEPIVQALHKLGEPNPKDVWMIGDTHMDLLCASSAGVGSIAVLSGYESQEVLQNYTNIVLKDATEAVQYLKSEKLAHS